MFGFQPFAFTPAAGAPAGPVITVSGWGTLGLAQQTVATPDTWTTAGLLAGAVAGDMFFALSASRTADVYTQSSSMTEIAGTAGGAGGTSLYYSLLWKILTAGDIASGIATDYSGSGFTWPNGYFLSAVLNRSAGAWTGASIFTDHQTDTTSVVPSGSIINDGTAVAFFESQVSPAPTYTAIDNSFTNFITGRYPFGIRSAGAAAYKSITSGVAISGTTVTGTAINNPRYAMMMVFQ